VKGLDLGRVPDELKADRRHVCWRYERGTKVLKVAGTLRNASSADPRTWRTFAECVRATERHPGRYAGVGRVIAKDDPFIGVDLDDCRDPGTGRLAPRAEGIVRRLHSYAEASPSEAGVKVWVRGVLGRAHKKPGVEVYPHGRYFTLTGWALPQIPPTVEERTSELEALIREEFPAPSPALLGRKPSRPYDVGEPGERIDLEAFLAAAGVGVLGEIPDGTAERVLRVICPWAREHTRGDRSGTRVGQYPDGALFFRCEHAHCAHRGWAEFRREVDPLTPRKIKACRARRVWGRA
jgi:hypothetical protein